MRWKHFAENHRCCTPPCTAEDPITNCTGSPEGFSHLWPYITCLLCSWWQSTTLSLWQTPTHPSMTINVTSSMQPSLTFPDTASCLILCFHRTWCRCSDSHCCIVLWWAGLVSASSPLSSELRRLSSLRSYQSVLLTSGASTGTDIWVVWNPSMLSWTEALVIHRR